MSHIPEGDNSWAVEAATEFLKQIKQNPALSKGVSQSPLQEQEQQRVTTDEAKKILTDDFLGVSGMEQVREYAKKKDITIATLWYRPTELYLQDLEFAKFHKELAIYLPVSMELGGLNIPSTINNLNGFFEKLYNKEVQTKREYSWYKYQQFATGGDPNELSELFYLHKEPLTGTQLDKYKQNLRESSARRKEVKDPSALEVILAELVYQANFEKMLFSTPVITRSRTNNDLPVTFYGFNATGVVLEKGTPPSARHYPVR